VKIKYAGVNAIDSQLCKGWFRLFYRIRLPYIIGNDCSGVVVRVGSKVKNFHIGQDVFGMSATGGTYAEYCLFHETELAEKPKFLSFLDAASIPTSGLAAYNALIDLSHVNPVDSVFVQGASGGVGSFTIQLAKYIGCYVAAGTTLENMNYVKSYLGADTVFDYRAKLYPLGVRRTFDSVIDISGDDKFRKNSRKYLMSKNSNFVRVGFKEELGMKTLLKTMRLMVLKAFQHFSGKQTHLLVTKPDPQKLIYIANCFQGSPVTQGSVENPFRIKRVVSKLLPLSEFHKAHELLDEGHFAGKIVLKVEEDIDDFNNNINNEGFAFEKNG